MRTRALNTIRDEDRYTDVYKRHYCNQCGGSFPVFRGLPHLTGSGLGDILRAVGRFVLPIFAPASSRFITSAAEGIKEGQTLKESAKRAVGPALSSALDSAGAHLTRKMSGSGASAGVPTLRIQVQSAHVQLKPGLASLAVVGVPTGRYIRGSRKRDIALLSTLV